MRAFLLFFSLFAAGAVSRAVPQCRDLFREEFLFGAEFTLTNQAIVDEGNRQMYAGFRGNPLKSSAWESFSAHLRKLCKKARCKVTSGFDKHDRTIVVTFRDGFFFTVGSDMAVLESNASPMRPSDVARNLKRIQLFVFDAAKEVGLEPHTRAGGGHIHISRKAFGENALAFRNFFVDFQNRPELAFGALGNHLGNGAPLAALKAEQRAALVKILEDVNGPGAITSFENINSFIDKLHERVFTQGYVAEWGSPTYYHAFNMTRMRRSEDLATLEIRSFRPQESAHQFLLQTRFLERWVNRVKDLGEPIPYLNKSRHNFSDKEIVDAFAQLLRDLDLPYQEYKVLLPGRLRGVQPSASPGGVSYRLEDYK